MTIPKNTSLKHFQVGLPLQSTQRGVVSKPMCDTSPRTNLHNVHNTLIEHSIQTQIVKC